MRSETDAFMCSCCYATARAEVGKGNDELIALKVANGTVRLHKQDATKMFKQGLDMCEVENDGF